MWSINLITNTVEITKECAEDLMAFETTQGYSWDKYVFGDEAWPTENFGEGGYLFFDDDAYEHMDYVHESELQEVLLKHKVNGEITFLDPETGNTWGYRFMNGICENIYGNVRDLKLKP